MVVGFDPSGYFQDGNILFGQALSSTYFAKMLFLLILLHREMTECLCVEYARTGDRSDFWHVQDESGFSDPYCSQTIGHRG